MTNTSERWAKIFARAAKERDPKKLLKIIEEINRLSQEKRRQPSQRRAA